MANVYTVEQVNNYIKNMFNSDFVLNRISVKGEVSNCKYHSSGHIYFTIKDRSSTLSAIMFAGNRAAGLRFRLEDGMQIVASGNITIYESAGKYQIYVRSIEQQGNGELYARYLALKKELEDMGMFDAMYKQEIPRYVRRLGVVTAATGAAIQDIINISTRRNPYIQIVLYPALVQGAGASESICNGIRTLDEYGVDVIIAGRGGGSIEDLWAFNEECVARTVFECKTPVISAVGHETDYTIIDFVADLRAPTPSAAAELAVTDMNQLISRINEYTDRLSALLMERVRYTRQRLDFYKVRLGYMSPANVINARRQKLDELSDRLNRAVNTRYEDARGRLALIGARLNGLSPLARLSMGYSYVQNDEGSAVTSVKDVKENELLRINVSDGYINTQVLDVNRLERQVNNED